jgi:anti-sigma-K factor RskA
MTDSDSAGKDNDAPSLTAAEYVLGLLSPAEMTTIRRALANDDSLRDEVALWEERFAAFADGLEPREPPARVLSALRSRMSPKPAVSHRAGKLWSSLGFWRGLSIAGLAAASVFGALYFSQPKERGAAFNDLVATINLKDGGRAAFVVSYDAATRQMLVVPASSFKTAERVPELWIVPAGSMPISLGVIEAGHPLSLTIPKQYAPHAKAGAVLVITLEPRGGAPGGIATGDVVARGEFSTL